MTDPDTLSQIEALEAARRGEPLSFKLGFSGDQTDALEAIQGLHAAWPTEPEGEDRLTFTEEISEVASLNLRASNDATNWTDFVLDPKRVRIERSYHFKGTFWVSPEGALYIFSGNQGMQVQSHEEGYSYDEDEWGQAVNARNLKAGLQPPFPIPSYPRSEDGILPLFDEPKERKKTRGTAIYRGTSIKTAASEPARAVISAALGTSPHVKSRTPKGQGQVFEDPCGNGLSVATISELGETPEERATIAEQLAKGLVPLSIKVLFASALHWAEQTGATRHNEYVDTEMSRIIALGAKPGSNPNAAQAGSWLQAFLPLVQSWVEVPRYSEPVLKGRKQPPRTGKEYERILAADRLETLQEGAITELTRARYHPGEWFFNDVFKDGGNQFEMMSSKALHYSAQNHEWLLRLIFYLTPVFLANKNNKAKGSPFTAIKLRDAAGLPFRPTDPGRFIDTLNRSLLKLSADGVVGDVKIVEPGPNFSASERIKAYRVTIWDPH